MLRKLAFGVFLLLAAATSHAGTAAAQFSVQITLTAARNTTGNGNACTSATGSGAGSASVQVRCTTDVFVNIAASASTTPLGNARFLPGYSPARDSLLPDYCRNEISRGDDAARMACRLDNQRQLATADDEADEGWRIESRRYATGTPAAETQSRLRLQGDTGTVTALRLAHAGNHSGSIEMLVSF